jgi:hypothetical protein
MPITKCQRTYTREIVNYVRRWDARGAQTKTAEMREQTPNRHTQLQLSVNIMPSSSCLEPSQLVTTPRCSVTCFLLRAFPFRCKSWLLLGAQPNTKLPWAHGKDLDPCPLHPVTTKSCLGRRSSPSGLVRGVGKESLALQLGRGGGGILSLVSQFVRVHIVAFFSCFCL